MSFSIALVSQHPASSLVAMAMAVMAASAQATASLRLGSTPQKTSAAHSAKTFSSASVAVRGFKPLALQPGGRLSRKGTLLLLVSKNNWAPCLCRFLKISFSELKLRGPILHLDMVDSH